MVLQNIGLKLEMFFVERKTLCDSSVTYKTFYFVPLTAERDNLMLLYGLKIPYPWPSSTFRPFLIHNFI